MIYHVESYLLDFPYIHYAKLRGATVWPYVAPQQRPLWHIRQGDSGALWGRFKHSQTVETRGNVPASNCTDGALARPRYFQSLLARLDDQGREHREPGGMDGEQERRLERPPASPASEGAGGRATQDSRRARCAGRTAVHRSSGSFHPLRGRRVDGVK